MYPSRCVVESVERDGISKIFTAATAIRTLSGYDDMYHERADLSTPKAVFSAGEPFGPAGRGGAAEHRHR